MVLTPIQTPLISLKSAGLKTIWMPKTVCVLGMDDVSFKS